LPLYAVQRLANGTWLVRTLMGDPILPAVDVRLHKKKAPGTSRGLSRS